MVRTPEEVDRTLDAGGGRCGLGILIETQDAVDRAAELARRPLSRIYVGLNDLRIDRRSTELFRPLVDGTVDAVRAQVAQPFGVGGLTLPGPGFPVSSDLLAGELVRLGPTSPSCGGRSPPTWPAATPSSRCRAAGDRAPRSARPTPAAAAPPGPLPGGVRATGRAGSRRVAQPA